MEKPKRKYGNWHGVTFTMSEGQGGFYIIEGNIHYTPCVVASISDETFENLDNNSRSYDDVRKKRRALKYCYRALNKEYNRKLQRV